MVVMRKAERRNYTYQQGLNYTQRGIKNKLNGQAEKVNLLTFF